MQRNQVIQAVLLAMVIASSSAGPALAAGSAAYEDQKVVYHNDGSQTDNRKYFNLLLGNVGNHVAAVGKDHIQVKVVDLSGGVDLLQQAATEPELAGKIDNLRAQGVVFLVCKNTLAARNIDWHTLYGVKDTDLVPSGVAEISRLQQQGYTYVHP